MKVSLPAPRSQRRRLTRERKMRENQEGGGYQALFGKLLRSNVLPVTKMYVVTEHCIKTFITLS